jgi:hypothetical protein
MTAILSAEDPSAPTGALNLDDTSAYERDIVERQIKLGDALCVVNTIEAIGDAVERTPDGMSIPAARALVTALEHLCSIDFGYGFEANTKLTMPAFEEFSTYRARKQASMEALAEIKEYGKKVWAWIRKMLSDIIAYIKKIFNVQKAKQRKLETMIEEETKAAKEARTLTITHTHDGFKDKATMIRLAINGEFHGGASTIAGFREHHELMTKLENGFLRIEADVLKYLDSAVKTIFVSGKSYSSHIDNAMIAVTAPLSGHYIQNKRELPSGVRTFETPLVFGGMSVYREAVVGQAVLENETLKTSVAATTGVKEAILPEVAPYLEIDDIELGLRMVKSRWQSANAYVNKLADAADDLTNLERMVGRIASDNTDNDMVQRRARRVLFVLHTYLDTRRVFAGSLVNYGHTVSAAMLNYCSKSTSSMKEA